ncbi:phosphotransferase [Sporolactobacillus shoreicorticis]|uniref:Aminoglycoside phosphotransferase family protein n=1 Tax=Sporolactobacillus shoreicorticis TaxID=1923877 RepID=A0ABW5S257_9BACL|nr:phosphotransferase [Sporolactobacillus shoreicorticis]MCO7125891.1 phosphotransferase [Sporolactobacillus shoreicorticis]
MGEHRTSFLGIPGSSDWRQLKPIRSGWSHDQKYTFQSQNQRYLLRLSEGVLYERRKKEFEALNGLNKLPCNVTKPVAFGWCDERRKCYTIMTWLGGEQAAIVLPKLNPEEQYKLGYSAGQIMRKIHRLAAPATRPAWSDLYNHKIDRKLAAYKSCGIRVDDEASMIHVIEANRALLKDRPQTFQHGDYHCGNMVISKTHEIGVIDFDRMDYGDPWEEFNRITWCANVSAAFATGQINGYFENKVPDTFFSLMALYIATNMISSIPWAIDYGGQQISVMKREMKQTLTAYDRFHTPIPKWYRHE